MKLLLLAFALLTSTAFAASGDNEIPEVLLRLQATHMKEAKLIGVSFENAPHWHTYWKNPGDAGIPTKVEFKLDGEKIELNEKEWPTPKRYIEEGDILAFGYEDRYHAFFELPDTFVSANQGKQLTGEATWLICKHVCIPGKRSFSGTIDKDGTNFKVDGESMNVTLPELNSALENLPKLVEWPSELDVILTANAAKEDLVLYANYSNANEVAFNQSANLLMPYPREMLTFKREEVRQDSSSNLYARHEVDWDGEYEEPEIPLPADGNFTTPLTIKFLFNDPVDGVTKVIQKSFNVFTLDNSASETFFASLAKMGQAESATATSTVIDSKPLSLWSYLLLAFLGGLILNVMPCVLPVITLKLYGLIQHQGESRTRIFKHNLFYTLGVLATFALLGVSVLLLKNAGETVGWGFQLQSPHFVAVMILVLFVFALNLFGLFEFSTPGGRKLGGVQLKDSMAGDFLSGVLATILSTPCSAPFLGTALTFAFTGGDSMIFLIFSFVGLGLAFPFILTGLFPKTVAFLPKPGLWMDHLKKFLGLTLILTLLWLLDVYSALVDTSISVLKLNTILALTFFAFFMRSHITKRKLASGLAFAMPLLMFTHLMTTSMSTSTASSGDLIATKQQAGLPWEAWSVTRMEELRSAKKKTFIDFTAKWCFTCKVNEKLVLETAGFKEFVANENITLLLGDWTKRDEVIGNWLQSQGLVGVPAYFVINEKGELIKLGETITLSEIKQAF